MDTRTEAELLEAAATDPEAFGVLVRRHQAFVYGAALRVTRNGPLAEEVTQETFFRAYRKLHTFRGQSALRTWLYRIATNLAIDEVSRRRESPMSELPDTPGDRTTAAEVEMALQSEALRAALRKLPERLRAPLVLREFEHRSYEDIAAALDVPLNTVRTRIFRAKEQIRELMSDWDDA